MPPRGPSLALEMRDGEPLENHATGYGVVVAIRAACDCAGVDIKGATVAIEGFGKVGGGVARYLASDGARVVAISNIDGTTALSNPISGRSTSAGKTSSRCPWTSLCRGRGRT